MPGVKRRGSAVTRAGVSVLLAGAAWQLTAPSAFIGLQMPAPEQRKTAMKGYRLDWMLEKKDGTGDLQTQDGYWVGEVGFEKSQNAQGLRYRMRPTAEEYKKGIEVN